ncbi:MAG: restriction endonuclease subunit S [Eubacterium sp.]|nr:restriction endonuclease subunit S [Eubacterium sp.]
MAGVPKIRFQGFAGDWERRKLEDAFDMTIPNNTLSRAELTYEAGEVRNIHYGDVLIKYGAYIDVQGDEIPFIIGGTLDEYKGCLLRDGDIIFADTAEDETTGKAAEIGNLQGEAVVSGLHTIVCRPIEKKAKYYLGYYLNSGTFHNQLLPLMQGIKVLSLNRSNLAKTEIKYPKTRAEQAQIGGLLHNLDQLIAFHQRKCDEIKELKKYMLQKMFPQNGKKTPEIRFAGFTGDWEQRRFCDFTFPASERNKKDLPLEPFAITNDRGFIPQSEAHDDFGYMKNTDRTAYNIVKANSFAYNPARINIGSIGYYEGTEDIIVSSLYEVFQTADYVDDRFLWHWFKSDAFSNWVERLQEGSVRMYFYYDKLCECNMLMPSIEEQKEIAKYFDNFDYLIIRHQRKCDELKEVKKFMLEKMFV